MKTLQTNPSLTWEEKTKRLRIIFPNITDNDLQFNAGKETVMIERLAYKLGKTADELRYIIHGIF